MVLNVAVKNVLSRQSAGAVRKLMRCIEPHIVPISSSHLQASITARGCVQGIAIASDVLEGVTSSPLVWPSPAVPLELIWSGEVVPGSQDLDGEDGCRCLAIYRSVLASWNGRVEDMADAYSIKVMSVVSVVEAITPRWSRRRKETWMDPEGTSR